MFSEDGAEQDVQDQVAGEDECQQAGDDRDDEDRLRRADLGRRLPVDIVGGSGADAEGDGDEDEPQDAAGEGEARDDGKEDEGEASEADREGQEPVEEIGGVGHWLGFGDRSIRYLRRSVLGCLGVC